MVRIPRCLAVPKPNKFSSAVKHMVDIRLIYTSWQKRSRSVEIEKNQLNYNCNSYRILCFKMRNLSLVDKKQVSCSFLKQCCVATVERNLVFFASQSDLCKIDVEQADAENNVNVCFNSKRVRRFFNLYACCHVSGGNIRTSRCWISSRFEVFTRRRCFSNCC